MTASESIFRNADDFCSGSSNFSGALIAQEGAGGELKSDGDYYREYNALHQLTRVRKKTATGKIIEEYSYGPDGERIMTVNYLTNTTIYTPFKEWMMIVNRTGTYNYTYVYDGNTLISKINPDGTKWFYHDDHLGSTSLITDENGNIVEETFYNPFGQVTSGGEREAYLLYTNQMKDAIGCYDYGARVYCPKWYHFTSGDPITANVFDPQGLNRFAYVKNNPYKYVDPNGENPVLIGAGIWIGGNALIGGITGIASEIQSQTRGDATFSDINWGQVGISGAKGTAKGAAVGIAGIALVWMGAPADAVILATDLYGYSDYIEPPATEVDPKKEQLGEIEEATTPEDPYARNKESEQLNKEIGNLDQTKTEGDKVVSPESKTPTKTQISSASKSSVKGASAARSGISGGYGTGSARAAEGNNAKKSPAPTTQKSTQWKKKGGKR